MRIVGKRAEKILFERETCGSGRCAEPAEEALRKLEAAEDVLYDLLSIRSS